MSVSTENFLKTVYRLSVMNKPGAKPGSIAKELGISNAAATDMARNLASKKLIDYEKYHTIKLTKTGKEQALRLTRKHRLWETLLSQLLNLSLGEIHREAELLEHQTSDFLADKISEYLGNPGFDPHGDPIPNKMYDPDEQNDYITIADASEGNYYKVKRLFGSEDIFFDFCETNGIQINTGLYIEKQHPAQDMTIIKIRNSTIVLNKYYAEKIFIEAKANQNKNQ